MMPPTMAPKSFRSIRGEAREAEARAVLRRARRLFVRFSDDRRLVLPLVVVVVLVVLVILVVLIVGVSRRRRVVHDGEEAPVDQPSGNVLEDIRGHVASCLGVATFADGLWNRRRGRS